MDKLRLEVLEETLEEVKSNWTQGIFEDDEGRVCALGALNKVVSGHARTMATPTLRYCEALIEAIPYELNKKARESITEFTYITPINLISHINDHDGQGAIIDIIQRAIRFEKARLAREQGVKITEQEKEYANA